MNKVVTRQVLASELPLDLRGSIPADSYVRIIIEEIDQPYPSVTNKLDKYFGSARHLATTPEEAVERVRKIRDEWE